MNKGEIVKRLISSRTGCDFVLCAGDDRTDEDMFKAIAKMGMSDSDSFTITIGSPNKMTAAKAHVQTPHEIIQLIIQLSETRSILIA